MYLHYQVKKAYQDELLRTGARDRLATQARRERRPRPHHPAAAPARRPAALRLRRFFLTRHRPGERRTS
jgi:hypothetical protein